MSSRNLKIPRGGNVAKGLRRYFFMVNINTSNELRIVNYESREIAVKKLWKVSDIVAFSNSVAESCIIDGIYYPATFDYSFKYYVVAYTTDMELPSDDDELEALIMNSDLFAALEYDEDWLFYMEEICRETIDEHLRAIERSSFSKIAEFGTEVVEMIDAFLEASPTWSIPENFGETLNELHDLAHEPQRVAKIYSLMQDLKDSDV